MVFRPSSPMTHRAAPAYLGGNYPANIEDWLIPVVGDMNLIPSPTDYRDEEDIEDILTLVARTGLAIFVPDMGDRRFHCREDAVTVGGFKVQIAVPIIGAKGIVLGTFQATPVIRTLIETAPRPRASSATRHARTVAFVKPGRGSWMDSQAKNSSSPRL
jgi:hypothetical protein